uniref:Uncharacterized protein n=1 Tax=Avena sativa TaxID=4498 RepID=A0ACD5XNL0_AVESA
MEMKLSSGEVHGGAGCKKRPPSRLQKKAPASLQVEPAGPAAAAQASPSAWGDGRTPIPLLSPLVTPPAPPWEGAQGGGSQQAEARSGGEAGFSLSPARHASPGGISGERHADEKANSPAPSPSGGWQHPAMPTLTPAPTPAPSPSGAGGWRHPAMPAPVAEPASLAPLFKSQCTVEMRNAQQ